MPMGALPPPDHGAVIVLAVLDAWRRTKGEEWCRKRGVGAARQALEARRDESRNVLRMLPPGTRTVEQTIKDAELVLTATCRSCGKCEMAKR